MGDAKTWSLEVQKAHRFWGDKRTLDNAQFQKRYGDLPEIPGLRNKKK
jgi:hypothetical protein